MNDKLSWLPREKDLIRVSLNSDTGKSNRQAVLDAVRDSDIADIDAVIASYQRAQERHDGIEFDDARFRNDLAEHIRTLRRVKAMALLLKGHDIEAAAELGRMSSIFRTKENA